MCSMLFVCLSFSVILVSRAVVYKSLLYCMRRVNSDAVTQITRQAG